MQAISTTFGLLWDGLFLQPEAYIALRDADRPVRRGLVVLFLLGVAIGVAGFIGATLEWASAPNLEAIQAAVLTNLQTQTWWTFIEQFPEARQFFESTWEIIWQVVRAFTPSPAASLLGIVLRPLALIISWLIFGLLAFIVARLLGGSGSLAQTLGATAVAVAPNLLYLLTAVPFLAVAGISAWTLLCQYTALRITHDLSWGRAAWAAILPPFLPLIFGLLLSICLGVILGPALFDSFAAGLF